MRALRPGFHMGYEERALGYVGVKHIDTDCSISDALQQVG
jgi:hypothetical protein